MKHKKRAKSVLKAALKSAPDEGPVLEFGVYNGKSINYLAELLPNTALYGFDSFEGFPDDGRRDWQLDLSVANLPAVADNVTLIKGFFDQSLPAFLSENPHLAPPRLLHIDCDLYSSTKLVFDHLASRLTAGSVIVFDELLHYKQFRENEFFAFYEFLEAKQLTFRWLAKSGRVMPLAKFLKLYADDALGVMQTMRRQGYHQNVAVILEERPADYEDRLLLYKKEAAALAETYPLELG